MKPQAVRIADVFIIGPLMLWAGLKLRKDYPTAGPLLAFFGGATVFYNGRNWVVRDNQIRRRMAA